MLKSSFDKSDIKLTFKSIQKVAQKRNSTFPLLRVWVLKVKLKCQIQIAIKDAQLEINFNIDHHYQC